MFILLGIVLFLLLIVAHEYGHFLVAKKNDVVPEEFGIGFPPRIVGKKMGKGIFEGFYSINWLPLGGFVQLKGESDSDKRKGSFGAASLWSKLKIIYAGVVINYILAIFFLTLSALISFPHFLPNQFQIDSDATVVHEQKEVYVNSVNADSPAQAAGLQDDDLFVSLGGIDIRTRDDLDQAIKQADGGTVPITVLREIDGADERSEYTSQVTLRQFGHEDGALGVNLGVIDHIRTRHTWSAPIVAFVSANQLIGETFKAIGGALGSLFDGDFSEAGGDVGGPVLIVYSLTFIDNFGVLFAVIGSLSMALAIMNALPIPALDGGRGALIILYRGILKRELSEATEAKINGAGMMFLLGFIVLITMADISKIF